MVALVYVLEPIPQMESIPPLEPIPALESIPFWNRFHAIPIPVLLAITPIPVPVPEKSGIRTPLVVAVAATGQRQTQDPRKSHKFTFLSTFRVY